MEIKNTDQIMRADIMLARIQDKNELANAGDIYVGTGNAPDVVDASAGEDGKVAKPTVKNIQTAVREDANRQQGLRLGEGTSSSYSNIVELGIGAKAEANGACQIGAGTNNVENSLKFRNRTVVNEGGEIMGDYPLGFTHRVSNIENVTWKSTWHNDIQSKNPKLITDWAFIDTSQLPWSTGEIAFVSTYDPSQTGGSPTKTNIVLDGRVYVDLGAHKVYAEGDTVDQAKQANYPTGFSERRTSGWSDGWPKFHSDLKDGTIVTDWAFRTVSGYNSEIAFVSTEDEAAQGGNLNLVIDGDIYVKNGQKKVYAEGDIVNKAENALNTSFSNVAFMSKAAKDIEIDSSGTYQFYCPTLGFSCLLYYLQSSYSYSPIFASYQTVSTIIAKNQKFYMRIGYQGKLEWYREMLSIRDQVLKDEWYDFTNDMADIAVYYRKID